MKPNGRKKPRGPTPEQIEAQADEFLLNADREMLLAISQNVQAICDGMEALKLPSNDPHYLAKLQACDRTRVAIANKLTQVDIIPNGNKCFIGVGHFHSGEAREIARMLSEHFETKILVHE